MFTRYYSTIVCFYLIVLLNELHHNANFFYLSGALEGFKYEWQYVVSVIRAKDVIKTCVTW